MTNDIIRKNVENYYNLVKEGNFEGIKLPKNIINETPRLYNTLREFDSDVFLLLVVGAAKSGKSTLVNLILDEQICKTGMGETTKRPAIYLPSDDKNGSILLFFHGTTRVSSTDAAEKNELEQFELEKEEMVDDIISYARGVKSLAELRNDGIRIDERSYSAEEVQNLVTLDSPKCGDPLLVLVKIPQKDSLKNLNSGIRLAVVDMPGLDGVVSKNLDCIEYKRLSQKADYVLFVESSMSVLNKESVRFIKENLPFREMQIKLVENLFDSIWWRDPKSIEKQLNDKIENSITILKNGGLLNVSHDILNLRLAAECDELKNPSHSKDGFKDINKKAKEDFHSFISELHRELFQNGKLTKENASVSELCSTFKKISSEINREIKNLENQISSDEEEIKKNKDKNPPKLEFPDIDVHGKVNRLLHDVAGELDNLIIPKKELDGKELKIKISEEKTRVCRRISKLMEEFYNKFSLKTDVSNLINRKIRSIYPDSDKLFEIGNIDDSELRDIEAVLNLKRKIEEIFDEVYNKIRENKIVILGVRLFRKSYNQHAVCGLFNEIKEEVNSSIENKKMEYCDNVENVIQAIFNNAKNKYNEICEEIKNQKIEYFMCEETKHKNSLNSYKKLKDIIK